MLGQMAGNFYGAVGFTTIIIGVIYAYRRRRKLREDDDQSRDEWTDADKEAFKRQMDGH
jgi:hypothetical protein